MSLVAVDQIDEIALDVPSHTPRVPTARRKIAILGFARGYDRAPFDDSSVAVVAMNELYRNIPRWDVWFELHDVEYLGRTARVEDPKEPERHLNWLKAQPPDKPIYMVRRFDDIPASVAYPLDRIAKRVGRYFTSSVGYMIAWAIEEILETREDERIPEPGEWIGLYGIDLASHTEYQHQRPNAEYLVGFARGLGIAVDIQESSAICKSVGLYGFEKPPQEAGLINEHYLQVQYSRAVARNTAMLDNIHTADGALQVLATLNKKHAELNLSPEALTFVRELIVTTEGERAQFNADWNQTVGWSQAFRLCLEALEYRRRGAYIPECDPLYRSTS